MEWEHVPANYDGFFQDRWRGNGHRTGLSIQATSLKIGLGRRAMLGAVMVNPGVNRPINGGITSLPVSGFPLAEETARKQETVKGGTLA